MTTVACNATNYFSPAKWVVSSVAGQGTHSTLAAAMAVAVSGDTIYLVTSTTENVTLKPGVNIVGPVPGSNTTQPTITGKLTMTGAGSCNIENLTLVTNSDYALAVTGSAASVVQLNNCYINGNNNTAIQFTSSSSSSSITLQNCLLDLQTTGITYYTHSANGYLAFLECNFRDTGASTTASSVSTAGGVTFYYCFGTVPGFATTSAGSYIVEYANFASGNSTTFALVGTGTALIEHSTLASGSAVALTIGTGTTATTRYCRISSSNTDAISGAGTLILGPIDLTSSTTLSVTTITSETELVGNLAINSGTAYAPVCGGTTAAGILQFANTGQSSSGYVWTSNGTSSLPSFQNVGVNALTVDGDSNSATPSSGTITFNANSNAGASFKFTGSSHTVSLTTTDSNLDVFIGTGCGNTSLTGQYNTCTGYYSGNGLTSGTGNCFYGLEAGRYVTSGGYNVAIGENAFEGQTPTGSYNVMIGASAGLNYTSSEASNILIGYDVAGTAAESNVLRIGTGTGTSAGNIATCIISGITGKTSASGAETYTNASNVLGTSTSSIRYKYDVQDIENSDVLYKLRPVSFKYKESDSVSYDESQDTQYGLIAEEVLNHLPEMCLTNDQGELYSLKYRFLAPLLLAEVQKLRKEIDDLKVQLKSF